MRKHAKVVEGRLGFGLAMIIAAAAFGCGGDGGGGSPTAPVPQPPQIAGSWSGTTSFAGLPALLTQMTIGQSGQTISNSTITMLGNTINISGTVTIDGKFVWQNVATGQGCGTLKGDMQVAASANAMSGTIELNALGCPTSGFYTGPASLSRSASTAAPDVPLGGEAEALTAALRALESTSPN